MKREAKRRRRDDDYEDSVKGGVAWNRAEAHRELRRIVEDEEYKEADSAEDYSRQEDSE